MMRSRRSIVRAILACLTLLLVAIVAAPYVSAGGFRNRIRAALEAGLQRHVTVGDVHYSLFPGPGFTVEDVAIADVPAAGVEPFAHVAELKAVLRFSSFFTGRISFASLRLDEPSVNVVRTASDGWNIQPVVNRAVSSGSGPHERDRAPDIEVRSGRINFKFGDTKSVFYISSADVDIYSNDAGALVIHFAGEPARTDHGGEGFGRITGQGMLRAAGSQGDQLTMGVQLERSSIEELCRLLGTGDLGVHGGVTANAHLTGPIAHPSVTGDLTIDGVHRWDLLPSSGNSPWTLTYRGAMDVRAQTLDLETASGKEQPAVMSARLHASDLSSPQWSVSVIFNGLPAGSLIGTARRLGAPLPTSVQIDGRVTGAIGYARPGGLEGQFALSSSSITAPDAPSVRADGAQFTIKGGMVSFGPADVLFDDGEAAQIAAQFDDGAHTLSVEMNTSGLAVGRLRGAASSLLPDAPVPLLDSAFAGRWRGSLSFARTGETPGVWSGSGELLDAQVQVPGLAVPVRVISAGVAVRGPEVTVTRLRGSAGATDFDADYHFSGVPAISDRVRLGLGACDIGEIGRLIAPALEKRDGLLARLRLRRAAIPEWLKDRNITGIVQVKSLRAAATPLGGLRALLRWEGASIALRNIAWTMGDAGGSGSVTLSLGGLAPKLAVRGKMHGLPWRDGTIDIDGHLDAEGITPAALAAATGEGTFAGSDLTLTPDVSFDEISGVFHLAAAGYDPRLLLDHLQAVIDRDALTGQGALQADGRIVLDLISGGRKPVRYAAQGFGLPSHP